MRARSDNGAATVEHIGLVVLIALLLMAAIAALVAAPPTEEARRLGSQLDRRIRCPARLPDPCWRDPLTEAYGRPGRGWCERWHRSRIRYRVPRELRCCRSTSATAAARAVRPAVSGQSSPRRTA